MIDWIWSHKSLFLICVDLFLTLIYLFVLIFKKKDKIENVLSYILESIPDLINTAEAVFGNGHGIEKKAFVLQLVKALKNKMCYSGSFDFDKFIEDILLTPQKKEAP